MKRYRLAIDIGGTFTDLVLFDKQEGTYKTGKVLTTLDNQAEGVIEGIEKLAGNLEDIEYFVHGTTAGLNAFLERKGANVALLVTEGFRDVYEIARANRVEMYSITYRKPKPLVKRRDIFEIPERILVDGSIEKALEGEALDPIINQVIEKGYNSVAVCLLHAYKNPKHELIIKEAFQKKGIDIPVSLSHEIAREWREYERTSTTVINSYVAPIVRNYLTKLEKETKKRGLENDVYIMQSNGGVMTSEIAKDLPIQTLMSGPVGGAIGGINIGELTDYRNLICVDMGGTSFDVSLIIDGKPDVTAETQMEGFPILTPMVNIHTVGAGGGSIAWIENGGLRVGPRSAGSNPGPACYRRGGTQPTVSDANLVLGRIDEHGFLGGEMQLDKEAAYQAVKSVADQLGLSVMETAEGICAIANAKMADAIRTLTVKKGIDPRDFVIVAFGGAGPMHAVFIAELLGIQKVLIPTEAGTFSAWGMLQTEIRYDAVRNFVHIVSDMAHDTTEELYKGMEDEASTILAQQNIAEKDRVFYRSADMRYVGQEYTVNVPFVFDPSKNWEENLIKLTGLFHDMHLRIYGHNNPKGTVEVVNLRVAGYGELDKLQMSSSQEKAQGQLIERMVKQTVWNGEVIETPVYTTQHLQFGHMKVGPAIIEDPSSTTVVPPGYRVEMDAYRNIQIKREG
ncbi:hydantoinase/oxoprolinase family protein [Aneurinibacillus terranovensis]|uniref:hydantoinase/oxoprolinase family protein n=1 Tax=Aneurinibacillus terranovensis TaxID=278991 RepID=UPI0003FE4B07|nr:hydantoinase/oxoprolinase family protein [Aneurinibacillus terranovensis]